MTPTPPPPDYTPDAATIERAGVLITTLGAALAALWIGGKRLHRFVGQAAFRREFAVLNRVPPLEERVAQLDGLPDQFRELLDMSRHTHERLKGLATDVSAMRQEHADGMVKLDDRITGVAREVSEIKGEMRGRDAAYDRRRTS